MKTKIAAILLVSALFGFAQETPKLEEKVDLGFAAPDFILPGVSMDPKFDGKDYTLSHFTNEIVVLEWVNHDCPFVKKCYGGHLQDIQNEFTGKGVVWLSIDSGKDANPQGAKIDLKLTKAKPTAYLLDPTGEVGKAFKVKQTPTMFVLNKGNIIAYHGALDSAATPKIADINGPNVRHYVVNVLDSLTKGKKVWQKPTKPYGCKIDYAKEQPAAAGTPAAAATPAPAATSAPAATP